MAPARDILLVYDKECPVCHFYCQLARIKKTFGNLQLIDAREQSDALDRITAAGLDIDQGMVLILDDEIYYGAAAIHMLSLLSSRSGLFNRLAYQLFRSKHVAKFLYPLLRACRNCLLRILGKSTINNLGVQNNQRF